MKPTVVIVGRPNVGKSTLFNRLTRSRDAIVADVPGLTRDRHYGEGRVGAAPYLVVDTGGFEPVAGAGILREMARQTRQALDEADAILFVVDARAGLTAQDRDIAEELRRTGRAVFVVVNKSEGMAPAVAAAEFHALGLGDPLPVSAAHGDYVGDLMDLVQAGFPETPESPGAADEPPKSRSSAGRTSGSRLSPMRCSGKSACWYTTSPGRRVMQSTSISRTATGITR